MEAGCKIIGERLKGSGMRWVEPGAATAGVLWERVRGCFDVRWSYFTMNTPQILKAVSAKLFVREQAQAMVRWNEMLEEIRDGLPLPACGIPLSPTTDLTLAGESLKESEPRDRDELLAHNLGSIDG